ncbi:hypothetical protein QE152_g26901 [Popillia japonica]|uniref:Uncharacterized protein n=1 Tax=Popillia japonica TaxID=7064 RepID=A0AAW1JWR5_POPJA
MEVGTLIDLLDMPVYQTKAEPDIINASVVVLDIMGSTTSLTVAMKVQPDMSPSQFTEEALEVRVRLEVIQEVRLLLNV